MASITSSAPINVLPWPGRAPSKTRSPGFKAANIFVAGSAVFGQNDYGKVIAELKEKATG